MAHLGEQSRVLTKIVSRELIEKRCNKPQRIKDIEDLLLKVTDALNKKKFITIVGYNEVVLYKPHLESLLDGMKRIVNSQNKKIQSENAQ